MTIAEAKAIARAKYPKATAISQSYFGTVYIHETRSYLSPVIGDYPSSLSYGDAWKSAAKAVQALAQAEKEEA